MTDGRSSVLTLTLLVMIDGEHLSLTNHSNWMVQARAESEVSVNRKIFESDSSTGKVFKSDLVGLTVFPSPGVTIETSSPMESSPSRLRLKSWLKTILAEEETPSDSSPS